MQRMEPVITPNLCAKLYFKITMNLTTKEYKYRKICEPIEWCE